ncbi:hypothetical protein [Sphingomonas sp.]|uniref:hypothetical protein n=1 Tax=Sphingomonas sp. TaxID=28214 RepID=UPI001B0C577E|nr:hypothetical protein [Sphingomonas sp.]MBO9713628.1 hypothetical protein [Sphingomonas sp.]
MAKRIAAWAACAASIGYGVPQILQVAGVLPDPIDRILIFAPSLALVPCYAVAVAALAAEAEGRDRGWRFGALALALLYGACASLVYPVQLGVVIPRELAHQQGAEIFSCCAFRNPLTVVDLLGYTYMSLSTLMLAPTYRGAARWALVANGVLAVPIFLQLFWPWLIWAAAPWLVTFPLAMALVARAEREGA